MTRWQEEGGRSYREGTKWQEEGGRSYREVTRWQEEGGGATGRGQSGRRREEELEGGDSMGEGGKEGGARGR